MVNFLEFFIFFINVVFIKYFLLSVIFRNRTGFIIIILNKPENFFFRELIFLFFNWRFFSPVLNHFFWIKQKENHVLKGYLVAVVPKAFFVLNVYQNYQEAQEKSRRTKKLISNQTWPHTVFRGYYFYLYWVLFIPTWLKIII